MTYTATFRIVQEIRKKPGINVHQIGRALNMKPDKVSAHITDAKKRGMYGLYRSGTDKSENAGRPCAKWSVDEAKYAELTTKYVRLGRPKAPPKPKAEPEETAHPREFPVYVGKYHTVWQPSSPYFQGAKR